MAIRKQCEECRFVNDGRCIKLIPSYDGSGCSFYSERIDLTKKDEQQQTKPITSNDNTSVESKNEIETPSKEAIHGWLLIFLIIFVGCGSIISLILTFALSDFNRDFADISITYSLVYAITGACTIVAFHKRDTDAVFLAKIFVILGLLSKLSNWFALDELIALSRNTETSIIRSIIWSCIWLVFLCYSKQVKRLIPVGYRRTKPRDWIIIVAASLLFLILYFA